MGGCLCRYVVTISRMFFAAAFDRLLPTKFAEINEKFHSPQLAILLVSVIWFIFITFFWYAGFAVAWLSVGIIPPIGYMLPFVAALSLSGCEEGSLQADRWRHGSSARNCYRFASGNRSIPLLHHSSDVSVEWSLGHRVPWRYDHPSRRECCSVGSHRRSNLSNRQIPTWQNGT